MDLRGNLKIAGLAGNLRDDTTVSQVEGFIIGALENGQWYRRDGYNQSEPMVIGFRSWLRGKYGDDDSLRAAWGIKDVTLREAQPPGKAQEVVEGAMLLTLPDEQAHADFREYVSGATETRIAEFSGKLKEAFGTEQKVYVPYGYTLESPNPDSGHFALSFLLDSEVDGFVGPVSYVDRGIGGLGGLVGPVHSALLHGKEWIVLDDTRTGIEIDLTTDTIRQPLALQMDDFARVQRRNFSVALIHGLGFALSDPQGTGNLHNATLWEDYGRMRSIYGTSATATTESQLPKEDTLTVVIDEESLFYEALDSDLHVDLSRSVGRAVFQAGVKHRFVLLKDILSGVVPASKAYLFMNAFGLSDEARERIHALLDTQDAAAIWLYAPGSYAEGNPVDRIVTTVQMKLKAHSKLSDLASEFALNGNWIDEGAAMNPSMRVAPSFFIKDDAADVFLRYVGGSDASGALRFFENGTSSVYICTPYIATDFLREILEVLDVRMAVVKRGKSPSDTLLVGDNLMLLHARDDGDRVVDLGGVYDVVDLFDPGIGWRDQRVLTLSMKLGETRLLRLSRDSDEGD